MPGATLDLGTWLEKEVPSPPGITRVLHTASCLPFWFAVGDCWASCRCACGDRAQAALHPDGRRFLAVFPGSGI